MKTPDDNNLDRLFREGLAGSDGKAEFREEDWAAMEDLLDGEKSKKRGIIWLYWLSGSVAALFLLFFGWRLLNPHIPATHQTAKVQVKKALTGNQNQADVLANRKKVSSNGETDHAKSSTNAVSNLTGKRSMIVYRLQNLNPLHSPAQKITGKKSIRDSFDTASITHQLASNAIGYKKKNNLNIDQENTDVKNSAANAETTELKATELSVVNSDDVMLSAADVKFDTSFTSKKSVTKPSVLVKNGKALKQNLGFKPQLSLAILTAPDVNGVNSLAGSKVGTNAGLQLNFQFSKRWSVNTGAAYAAKPYEIYNAAGYSSGYTPVSAITNVNADCRVLDIPINLNYQFYSNQKHAFSIGSGLSSYLMLREHYEFYYANNTEWNYNLANQNKHFLSVLNLNATYQRQISQKFNVIVQPYFKIPLKGIGYERVNLQSAGVALGVGWNFRSFKIK